MCIELVLLSSPILYCLFMCSVTVYRMCLKLVQLNYQYYFICITYLVYLLVLVLGA